VKRAGLPRSHSFGSAVIAPCREQDMALRCPQIRELTARLRSREPIASRGAPGRSSSFATARGPCYNYTHRDALSTVLNRVAAGRHRGVTHGCVERPLPPRRLRSTRREADWLVDRRRRTSGRACDRPAPSRLAPDLSQAWPPGSARTPTACCSRARAEAESGRDVRDRLPRTARARRDRGARAATSVELIPARRRVTYRDTTARGDGPSCRPRAPPELCLIDELAAPTTRSGRAARSAGRTSSKSSRPGSTCIRRSTSSILESLNDQVRRADRDTRARDDSRTPCSRPPTRSC